MKIGNTDKRTIQGVRFETAAVSSARQAQEPVGVGQQSREWVRRSEELSLIRDIRLRPVFSLRLFQAPQVAVQTPEEWPVKRHLEENDLGRADRRLSHVALPSGSQRSGKGTSHEVWCATFERVAADYREIMLDSDQGAHFLRIADALHVLDQLKVAERGWSSEDRQILETLGVTERMLERPLDEMSEDLMRVGAQHGLAWMADLHRAPSPRALSSPTSNTGTRGLYATEGDQVEKLKTIGLWVERAGTDEQRTQFWNLRRDLRE